MPVKTAGIFVINSDKELLVAHPTGHDFWSIPKGKLEEGETITEAAIRETWEETNFVVNKGAKLHELERVKYKHGKKVLYPMVLIEDIDEQSFVSQELKCNTLVDANARWNAGKPEMDDFKWVSLTEAKDILHYTQAGCIETIVELLNNLNGEEK
jgi:8-oxo-dGTP diphosphatase